jgi:hypothetical protein
VPWENSKKSPLYIFLKNIHFLPSQPTTRLKVHTQAQAAQRWWPHCNDQLTKSTSGNRANYFSVESRLQTARVVLSVCARPAIEFLKSSQRSVVCWLRVVSPHLVPVYVQCVVVRENRFSKSHSSHFRSVCFIRQLLFLPEKHFHTANI